jgi:2-polyprenyl-3-methyl-5-hydroxy-6-metoxy-1,4-benzoquinol methylase
MADRWKSAPLDTVDGIPVFTKTDRYVANYQHIANDHLERMRPGAANPWIPDALWEELEASTETLIRRYARPGAKILDMGVGLGRLLSRFPELERYGIDISLDYLRIARDLGIEVAFSRIEDCPYRNGMFDIVVCCDVLEHVLDLTQCCREILRVLKPGGTIVVRVPNEENLDVYLNDNLPYEYIHLRNFDLSSLRLLFSTIFECKFLEALPAGLVYLQGAPRLRLRPLQQNRLARLEAALSETVDADHPLFFLKRAAAVSEEQLVQWIYELRDNHPEQFAAVASELVIPIEINVVFKTPQ